ncbi:MAG: creatininase family protein [Xanthomonadaceae bacterium]|nr:creatininase family protein [Xanthomonadaceae bacterium]
MRLDQLPHNEIQKLVNTGAPVFVCVNPVEFHGPHLSLATDSLVSFGMARRLYESLVKQNPEWPYLEWSSIELGVEPTPGLGTTKTSFFKLKYVIHEAAKALAAVGVKRVIWVSFHGAPAHNTAIQLGIDYLHKRGIPSMNIMNSVLDSMLYFKESEYEGAFTHIEDQVTAQRLLSNMTSDLHGGFFETSMAIHYAPESVTKDLSEIPDCPKFIVWPIFIVAMKFARFFKMHRFERELWFGSQAIAWSKIKPFPGYTGAPRYANAESGKFFAEKLNHHFVELYHSVFVEKKKARRPMLEWSVYISSVLFG